MLERLPSLLLRAEGVAVLAGALAVYAEASYDWLLLALLALAPDLSLLAYAAGVRAGTLVYDAAHTYVGPVALGALGFVADWDAAVQPALVWLGHIGADRFVGYGLKYPAGFRETHLQRV